MSRRTTVLVVSLPLLLLACLLLLGFVKYSRLANHFGSLQAHLRSMEGLAESEFLTAPKREDLVTFRTDLTQIRADLLAIKAELGPVLALAPYLGWLPVVGGDLAASPDLLEMGIGVSTAGDLLFQGLEPMISLIGGSSETSMSANTMETLSSAVAEGQPLFQEAHDELLRVRELRDGLDERRLSSDVTRLLARLDYHFPMLDVGIEALLVAPSLLGADEPRTYLLLAQNEQELRATGGFISSVALLRLSQGRILELDFRDSYAVDDLSRPHPAAPRPLEEYMLAQLWLLRDANWYPDFPTSAIAARDLYELDQGVLVDGVVAADLTTIQLLVGVMEPIRLEGYDEGVTAANVMELMQRYWAFPGGDGQSEDWWAHRKDFMGDLLSAMIKRIGADISSVDLPRLAGALGRSLEEKHLVVYMVDPVISEKIGKKGWDGAIASVEGDYLMVVDSNVGFNKVNASVQTGVGYQVSITDGETISAHLTIAYNNASRASVEQCVQEAAYPATYQGMMEGCYWDYLRVYVPHGSQLLQGPQLSLPEGSLRARESGSGGIRTATDVGPAEAGKAVYKSFFVVAPRDQRGITYEYQLPATVLLQSGSTTTYRLLVQKQAGTLAVPLQVEVKLPIDATILSASPGPSSGDDTKVVFSTDLRVDREFEVVFR
jgi:hypothetical protein